MNSKTNQPDWHRIAEKFDYWLPQLAPVGTAMLEALPVQPGDRIIDLASGTGEPALTLARYWQEKIEIIGTDAAAGMVKVAQQKAQTAGLTNISFQTMPAEHLSFADDFFDKALCRFGIMLFDDPLVGLKEIRRVLKPGGSYAFAVWSNPEWMPTMLWAYEVFKNRIPEEYYPPLYKVTSLGLPGAMETMMNNAGYTDFLIEPRIFYYQFASFQDYWDTVEKSDILKLQYDVLATDQRQAVRDEIAQFAKEYQTDEGLRIPHEYLLVTGAK